jgi:uncharacterized repeat protein (TIGR03803 family)
MFISSLATRSSNPAESFMAPPPPATRRQHPSAKSSTPASPTQKPKVFWFFFSKKNRFLPNIQAIALLATTAAHAQITQTTLYAFTGGVDGDNPDYTLLLDNSGGARIPRGIYGDTPEGGANAFGAAFALTRPKKGQTVWNQATLWSFSGGADGGTPLYAGLYSRAKHITPNTPLYGTTLIGGAGFGTVFSLTADTLTPIWTFTGGMDGAYPTQGTVIGDKTGALYLAANAGGKSGCGTIIKLTPPGSGQTAWTETTVWTFSGAADGCSPNGVVIGGSGGIYATALGGGATTGTCGSYGCGTVLKLTPPGTGQTAWTEQTLHAFQPGTDGALPLAGVAIGAHGILYGTTYSGGLTGYGTVYILYPPPKGLTAWTEQILWNFTNGLDGSAPLAPVILDTTGALYGTAAFGGKQTGLCAGLNGCGTVWKLVLQNGVWTQATLWDFAGPDGASPTGALAADNSGNLYGTAYNGGPNACGGNGCGLVFSLAGTGYSP